MKAFIKYMILVCIIASCGQKYSNKQIESTVEINEPKPKQPIIESSKDETINSNWYYIQKDNLVSTVLLNNSVVLANAFNQPVTIIDTLRSEINNGQKINYLKIKESDAEVPDVVLSRYKFPVVKPGYEMSITSAEGGVWGGKSIDSLYTYEVFVGLNFFLEDSLNLKEGIDFLFHSDYDEETHWRQKACCISINKLSFYSSVQLFIHVANLADEQLHLKQNYLFNKDVKIWYAFFESPLKKEDVVFVRVIEKDKSIQMIVDYQTWYNYDDITKNITSILKTKNYTKEIWRSGIALDERFEYIHQN